MNLSSFNIDGWTLWGFAAQFIFFLSFAVQWYKSEKQKASVLPLDFWLLRMAASVMLLVYVVVRRDVVFMVSLVIQMVIYGRNIYLMTNNGK